MEHPVTPLFALLGFDLLDLANWRSLVNREVHYVLHAEMLGVLGLIRNLLGVSVSVHLEDQLVDAVEEYVVEMGMHQSVVTGVAGGCEGTLLGSTLYNSDNVELSVGVNEGVHISDSIVKEHRARVSVEADILQLNFKSVGYELFENVFVLGEVLLDATDIDFYELVSVIFVQEVVTEELELAVKVVNFLAQLKVLTVHVLHLIVTLVSIEPLVPEKQVAISIVVKAPNRQVVALELEQDSTVVIDLSELPLTSAGVSDDQVLLDILRLFDAQDASVILDYAHLADLKVVRVLVSLDFLERLGVVVHDLNSIVHKQSEEVESVPDTYEITVAGI